MIGLALIAAVTALEPPASASGQLVRQASATVRIVSPSARDGS
jgi:hypothetical protein